MQRWIETSDGIKFPVSDSHLRKIPWFKNMLDDTIDDGAPIQIQYSFEKFMLAVGSTMYENWIDSEAKDYFLVEDPVTHLKNGTIISDPKTQRLYYDRNKDDTIKFDAMGRNVQEGLVLEAILDHNTEFLNIPYEGITRFQYFFKDRWNRNVYLFGDIDYLWLYYVYGYLSYGGKKYLVPNIFEEIKPSDLKELANSYVLIEMSFEFALTLGLMQRNDHPMMRVFDAKDPFFMLKYWKLHPCPYSKELDVFVINQVVEVPEDGPLGEKFLQAGLDINHVHNYQGRRRGFRQTALTAFASDYDEINWFRLIWLIQHGADVTFKREEKNNASYHENSFLELILRNIRNEVIRDPEYPNQLTLEDLVDVLIAVKAPVSSLLESARSVVHNAKNLENSSAVLTQLQRLEVCP